MKRLPIKSSNIISIGYDKDDKILEIQFKNGIYQYKDVKKEVYEAIMKSESQGKFFYQFIRGTYESNKLEESQSNSNSITSQVDVKD